MTLYVSSGNEKDPADFNRSYRQPRIQPQMIVPKTVCDHAKGKCPAPGLPELNPYGVPWCERTQKWYVTMAHSPQSKLFAETDWEALEEACIAYDMVWNRGPGMKALTPNAMILALTELRRRVQCWGYNHYDRIQLRLKIPTPQQIENEEAEVAQYAEKGINYLEMLNEMVADKQQVDDG